MLLPLNRISTLIFPILFSFCGTGATNKSEIVGNNLIADSISKNDVLFLQENKQDSLVLYENKIYHLTLPFERIEVLSDLEKTFQGLTVAKEIGQQDGPDFPLYSIKDENGTVCFFAMDWEDTLKLVEVYIKTPLIVDQYGLRVGDDYQRIKALRDKNMMISTNLHQHTFVYFDNSNIEYEISGDLLLPDSVDFENLMLTEVQIKDWVIEAIIWRE